MKARIALSVLVLATVGCVIGVPTNAEMGMEVGSAPVPDAVRVEYTIVGTVNVRSCPSTTCGVVGYYYAGDRVNAECRVANSGEMWCSVTGGYAYGPCLGIEGVCR